MEDTGANSIRIPVPAATERNLTYLFFYTLIAFYAVSRVLQAFPQRAPLLATVVLHVLPPLLFALLHGRVLWGWRGILVFFTICSAVSGAVEKIGITTGFPFGRYFFTDAMGPKISGVPVFLGLAYLGMAYLSWFVASLILGWEHRNLTGWRVVALPAFAAFVMTSWDFCLDPVWSTIVRAWIWTDGGAYFGVPISNFVGWYVNVFAIYLLFALYLRRRATKPEAMPTRFWRIALVFYGVSVVGNFFNVIPHTTDNVADATGKLWPLGEITGACALATVFTMGAFLLLACIRLADRPHPGATQSSL
ncbi:MAG TPA: carotenoid biosynthesis protein [Candidatus Sulfotelmatobacter sp.]|nr:carotenoid biosynthesis protein [Candidatus Sulfotelmatobacter sp.]